MKNYKSDKWNGMVGNIAQVVEDGESITGSIIGFHVISEEATLGNITFSNGAEDVDLTGEELPHGFCINAMCINTLEVITGALLVYFR